MKGYIFILVNILIILATELTGALFYERGVIHMIALLFVFIAAIPLARNYYLADPIFKKFLNASIFAFLLFSISHIFEFILFSTYKEYGDYIFAVAVNFYLSSILLMIVGSEIFIRAYSGYRRSRVPAVLTLFAITALLSLSFIFIKSHQTISLEPGNPDPYLYAAFSGFTAFLFLKRIQSLRKTLGPAFIGFFRYLKVMLIFVMISLSLYVFYELIEEAVGVPTYQIVYFSHFFFYGGLSMMFLAFEELLKTGGVVKDVREFLKNKKKNLSTKPLDRV